jgi:hypothetical protein
MPRFEHTRSCPRNYVGNTRARRGVEDTAAYVQAIVSYMKPVQVQVQPLPETPRCATSKVVHIQKARPSYAKRLALRQPPWRDDYQARPWDLLEAGPEGLCLLGHSLCRRQAGQLLLHAVEFLLEPHDVGLRQTRPHVSPDTLSVCGDALISAGLGTQTPPPPPIPAPSLQDRCPRLHARPATGSRGGTSYSSASENATATRLLPPQALDICASAYRPTPI